MSAAEIGLDPVVPEATPSRNVETPEPEPGATPEPEADSMAAGESNAESSAESSAESGTVVGAEESPAAEATVAVVEEPPAVLADELAVDAAAVDAAAVDAAAVDEAAVDGAELEAAPAVARVPIVVERRAPEVYPVPDERKRALMLELLERGQLEQVVVFTRTKHRANRVAEWLAKRGVVADRIHSQRSHRQRKEALLAFRDGKCRILVAAARAGRMLEVETPCAVVHFDMPETVQEWKERLGEKATALPATIEMFFVSELDEPRMTEIEAELGAAVERRVVDGFDYSAPAQPTPAPEDRREERRDERRDERPAEPSAERRGKPKSRRSKPRRRGGAAAPGVERPVPAGGNVVAGADPGDDREDGDEARIRAVAEAQQAAAVAARFNPSRMGMMELRSGPAGGGRSSRKKAHRGGSGRGPF